MSFAACRVIHTATSARAWTPSLAKMCSRCVPIVPARELQGGGDLLVRKSAGDERCHLTLTFGEQRRRRLLRRGLPGGRIGFHE